MSVPRRLTGEWRIVETEACDKSILDLMSPARIAIDAKGRGEFSFGCIDGTFLTRAGGRSFVCSWVGIDEMRPVTGDIRIGVEADGVLIGEIRFCHGDRSSFRAVPWTFQ